MRTTPLLAMILLATSCASMQANPVFDAPSEPLKGDELYFLSEIAQGTHEKFEYRTSTGKLFLDRTLCPRPILGTGRMLHAYPTSYGISPGRFNVDRDPLDLIVLGSAGAYRELARKSRVSPRIVRVIGMMKFDECEKVPCSKESQWQQDWKVFGVDIADAEYGKAHEISDLPESDQQTVRKFYSNYKGPKKDEKGVEHPQTRVTGFLGKSETLALIEKDFHRMSTDERKKETAACLELFQKIASTTPEPVKDEAYLSCLQRVQNPEALPGRPLFNFFLQYNAGIRLLALGAEKVSLSSALALMQDRKEKGKTYYRFVGKDLPSPPGTGNPVFEWVETKNRNAGCPAGFPAQHYESRPLVDRE